MILTGKDEFIQTDANGYQRVVNFRAVSDAAKLRHLENQNEGYFQFVEDEFKKREFTTRACIAFYDWHKTAGVQIPGSAIGNHKQDETLDDPGAEVTRLAKLTLLQDPECKTFGDALAKVIDKNPELAERYVNTYSNNEDEEEGQKLNDFTHLDGQDLDKKARHFMLKYGVDYTKAYYMVLENNPHY